MLLIYLKKFRMKLKNNLIYGKINECMIIKKLIKNILLQKKIHATLKVKIMFNLNFF